MTEWLEIATLVLGVPVLLMTLMLLLARFEASLVAPDERAGDVVGLVPSGGDPDRVEAEAARILASSAPRRADASPRGAA
ncbi:MAG: hypothetical protein H0V93_02955 [Euzebyales bacterium]|jgi:hypothetical protein|nr:hypothetical protein [Euzebyales bacterium]